jgi:hypothetical protein
MGTSLSDAGSVAIRTVSDHPVPAIMIGAGVAWLLVETLGRRTRAFERMARSLSDGAEGVGEVLSTAGDYVRESVGGVAENVREGAGRVGEYVQSGWSTAADAIREGTSAATERAQRGYEAGRETLAETWEEHPLAVGVAVMAAGVAAGLLLPRTRREDQLMGQTSDELARRVRKTGKDVVKRGKKAATAALSATTRQARQLGIAPEQVGRKVGRLATAARNAVTEAAGG